MVKDESTKLESTGRCLGVTLIDLLDIFLTITMQVATATMGYGDLRRVSKLDKYSNGNLSSSKEPFQKVFKESSVIVEVPGHSGRNVLSDTAMYLYIKLVFRIL